MNDWRGVESLGTPLQKRCYNGPVSFYFIRVVRCAFLKALRTPRETSSPVFCSGVAALFLFWMPTHGRASVYESWQEWILPELGRLREQEQALQESLSQLGTPVLGQTVSQFGYLHPRLKTPPPTLPWIQVDLGKTFPIDLVALIPAQVDWQPVDRGAHGFPLRFRVDVSDDKDFASFIPVAAFLESDVPNPGVAPVSLKVESVSGRFVRLTVTKLPKEDGQYVFALGELMVLSGNRNIAQGASVSASAKVSFPPRWALEYAIDGRTALGPPIRRELLPYDGLYSGPVSGGGLPWMTVDLGKAHVIDEVRLHPIHARLGADIPGYSFPTKMSVELSLDESFATASELVIPPGFEFTNPGNNPVTLSGGGREARYVRVRSLRDARFGLSEVEVYAGGVNVARGSNVLSPGDPVGMSKSWPLSQLVDGYTSYGKLIELPRWLAEWEERKVLENALREIRLRRPTLEAQAQRTLQRALMFGGAGCVVLVGLGIVIVHFRGKRRKQEELAAIRARFAHDLHDEIGSNLAAISVLSQIAQQNNRTEQMDAWEEIQEIANESNEVLREVLWVSGARQEMGRDFVSHLQKVACRMLPESEIRWMPEIPIVPQNWSLEERRQVFLFFKEALTNVIRHAAASSVELALEVSGCVLTLSIRDNGKGISAEGPVGSGLASLKERARALGGECRIESGVGRGTVVELRVPITLAGR